MFAKIKILLVLIVLFITHAQTVYSQNSPKNSRKQDKELSKQRRKRDKEAQKEYDTAIKMHYDRQGKKTEKRMKKNKRKAKRNKKNKRPPFWEKWF